MIVLVDINRNLLQLYGIEGMVELPFEQAHTIGQYANAERIFYVTNAVEVNAVDIVNLVRHMGVSVKDASPETSGNKYVHAVDDGTLYISKDLKFQGKFDLKLLDKDMTECIERNDIVRKLLDDGKIEIIGEVKKNLLFKELKVVEQKKVDNQKKADEKLDGIILNVRVDDWDGKIAGDDIGEEIDLEVGGKVGVGEGVAGVETMSELLDKIEGSG